MKNVIKVIIVLSLLFSCKDNPGKPVTSVENQDQLLLPVLWYQRSGEMQALYYQGYNIAKASLAEKAAQYKGKTPGAVIMDIDETLLDNSPVEAYQVLNNVPFSAELWSKWVGKVLAEPLPGSLEFTRYAEKLGVEIFYVTNRKFPEEFLSTIENLRSKGFPYADSLHLILKRETSSKKARRDAIAGKFEILLLIGDNLADFDDVFENRGDDLCFGAVKERKNDFGSRFIILPNPMYGPWINAAIKNSQGNTTGEKMKKSIISF